MKNKLRKIGFWHCRGEKDNLPFASEFIDKDFWHSQKQILVIKYIKENSKEINHYKGSSKCRFCKKTNGSTDYSDGEYIYPSGYLHYIEEHNIIPPPRFMNKVLNFYK